MIDQYIELNLGTKLDRLRDVLRRGDSVFFVGAGCSQGLGFPSWIGLLESMSEKLCSGEIKIDHDDTLASAEKIKEYVLKNDGNLDAYEALLHQTFSKPPPDENLLENNTSALDEWKRSILHQRLFELNVRGFVTTNYDPALSYYSEKYKNNRYDCFTTGHKGKLGRFLFDLHKADGAQAVYHLHGEFERSDEIILTGSDYLKLYGGKDNHSGVAKKSMWAILSTRPVVFIGFSFEDDYINQLLSRVAVDTWNKFNISGETRHFALIPYLDFKEGSSGFIKRESLEKKLREEHSVETIYFSPDNNFIELEVILGDLAYDKSIILEDIENDEVLVDTASEAEVQAVLAKAKMVFEKTRKKS
jgi:hypothetical protein